MLADGGVYENKLYKHRKMFQNLTFKDFQSQSLAVQHHRYALDKEDFGC